MKKLLAIIFLGLFISVSCAANPNFRTTATNTRVISGYDFLQLEAVNSYAPTTAAIIVYADNIAGYSTMDFYVTGVSSGNAISTCSVQAVYSDGSAVTTAQTLTSGTDITDLKSAYYKITIPADSVTRNVSFNFLIAD